MLLFRALRWCLVPNFKGIHQGSVPEQEIRDFEDPDSFERAKIIRTQERYPSRFRKLWTGFENSFLFPRKFEFEGEYRAIERRQWLGIIITSDFNMVWIVCMKT